ncbi:FAD-dependent oxidoreductase [Bradymonas sediminis]|uniref:Kynurenine 3-monooxygenase n=1 Tax=Bradymonas sediminis TaxID=1548548 RepID=A0A2Z4FIN6_9DELT|nr:NAD(P)/FAD-dependent oxidoreductase [Bradymonas sediminis]AWV88773.1 kynurenine 3-monooxygenase [Bradymonas sediminis]TDP61771.1 kynurenine 3-monooxygenase [Bradymonas sediminis]
MTKNGILDSDKVESTVIGAGPVGCVLALVLARRGHQVTLYERRPDIRHEDPAGGRSINLVLTERGLRILGRLGLRDEILSLTVPVLGRMMHSLESKLAYQPYGKDDSECNYSVSRTRLNASLLDAAEAAGVAIHFNQICIDADFESGQVELKDAVSGEHTRRAAGVIFGADGSPSAIRHALVAQGHAEATVDKLNFGYKELYFPAPSSSTDTAAMADHALHIWPRGDHFLMGLANLDGSFTGTAYLPLDGKNSFAELDTPASVRAFFEGQYPDSVRLLSDDFVDAFLANPTGTLGTVRCAPYHLDARALLVGDAAHGIVPFFGQGLNCGFEDCLVLDDLFEQFAHNNAPPEDRLAAIFAQFSALRKPNADAIAEMALDNFVEMRAKVGDPNFLLQKKVEHRIENEMPDIYRSRYAVVMYSALPYRRAFEIGELQQAILRELCEGIEDAAQADMRQARDLIEAKLLPYYERFGIALDF